MSVNFVLGGGGGWCVILPNLFWMKIGRMETENAKSLKLCLLLIHFFDENNQIRIPD
jgi:hypothetical protein